MAERDSRTIAQNVRARRTRSGKEQLAVAPAYSELVLRACEAHLETTSCSDQRYARQIAAFDSFALIASGLTDRQAWVRRGVERCEPG